MKLSEIGFELCKAALARRSSGGVTPTILSFAFDATDGTGRVFALRAQFSFGNDYTAEITLDDEIDLTDGDWRSRFDHAVFEANGESKWWQ